MKLSELLNKNFNQNSQPVMEENYDEFDDEEQSDLRSGSYVRDKEDSSGEVFIMRGDPYERRVQITDRNGSGWNISPSRLIAVANNDPAIARYFGGRVRESIDDGRAYIKRVTRKRIDGSTEVRYNVIDGNGVTIKAFDDSNNAKAYLRANRDLLDKI
jgi:hypothetical protein